MKSKIRTKVLNFLEWTGLINITKTYHIPITTPLNPERLIFQAINDYERTTKKKIKEITTTWRGEPVNGKTPKMKTYSIEFDEIQ